MAAAADDGALPGRARSRQSGDRAHSRRHRLEERSCRGGQRPEAVPADTGVSKPAPSRLDGPGEGHGSLEAQEVPRPGGATARPPPPRGRRRRRSKRGRRLWRRHRRAFRRPRRRRRPSAVPPAGELPAPSESRKQPTRRSGGVLVSLPMPSRADELRERRIVRFQTFDNEEQSEAGRRPRRPALARGLPSSIAADAHERLTALLRETEAASAACCDATAAALSGDHRGWAGAMARANSSQ